MLSVTGLCRGLSSSWWAVGSESTPVKLARKKCLSFPKIGGGEMDIPIGLDIAFSAESLMQRWHAYFETGMAKPGRGSMSTFETTRAAELFGTIVYINPAPTAVTHFSSWIHDLVYFEGKSPKNDSLRFGKTVEQKIRRAAKEKYKNLSAPSNWELIHNGMDMTTEMVSYQISSLQVKGTSLRGCPDLVFRESGSGRILIVETKATKFNVPTDGWPDMRAQLWAYGQIDQFKSAPSITLAAEIWREVSDVPVLTRIMSWDSADALFDSENRKIFDLFKAIVEDPEFLRKTE
jgi:hypothetical protein